MFYIGNLVAACKSSLRLKWINTFYEFCGHLAEMQIDTCLAYRGDGNRVLGSRLVMGRYRRVSHSEMNRSRVQFVWNRHGTGAVELPQWAARFTSRSLEGGQQLPPLRVC